MYIEVHFLKENWKLKLDIRKKKRLKFTDLSEKLIYCKLLTWSLNKV